jgi:hypothetical protein
MSRRKSVAQAVGLAAAIALGTTSVASAGLFPLTLGGDDSGWAVLAPDDGTVAGIVVDLVTPTAVYIEIDKDFLFPMDVNGNFPAINLIFQQTADDANTVPNIVITDESVSNQTGQDWTDFHWALVDGGSVWFDKAASTPFNVSPFTNSTYIDLFGFNDGNSYNNLNVDGGVVPAGTSFFPGLGGSDGELVITFDLASSNDSFNLKEFPTPEPAVLAMLAFGGVAVLRRRRS